MSTLRLLAPRHGCMSALESYIAEGCARQSAPLPRLRPRFFAFGSSLASEQAWLSPWSELRMRSLSFGAIRSHCKTRTGKARRRQAQL